MMGDLGWWRRQADKGKIHTPLAPRNAGAPQNAGFQFLWITYPLV